MIYTILFLIGLIGLGAMLLMGFGHTGAHGGHIGHEGGHAGHIGHGDSGHAHGGHDHSHHGDDNGQGGKTFPGAGLFWQLISPLTLMTLCLGAGATGLLVRDQHWSGMVTGLVAALGAVGLNVLIVRPMLGLVFRFASKPSLALEGTRAKTAEAASKFDESGRGVVTVNVDGQVVRVLANLEAEDRPNAGLIKPGDSLTVTAVDGHSNSCTVARF